MLYQNKLERLRDEVADACRVALVNQAANAFKTHLPASSPMNLVTEKSEGGRVY